MTGCCSLRTFSTATRTIAVKSLPDEPEIGLRSFDSFTRVDGIISPRHTIGGLAVVFPREIENLSMNTFRPPEVTPEFNQSGTSIGVQDRFAPSPAIVLESTVAGCRSDRALGSLLAALIRGCIVPVEFGDVARGLARTEGRWCGFFTPMTKNSPKLRVLVVDDEFLIRWSIAETLESAGHEVLQAGNGRDALCLLTEPTLGIDAVVLDYRLPDSNDLALLGRIRQLAPGRPVIMMSAFGSRDIAQDARALGAYDVLTKPFDLQHLHSLIREACGA